MDRRTPSIPTFALTLLLLLAGLASAQAPVEDDLGRAVRVDTPPQRLVTMVPSHTELVCALDACERLVGVDAFSDHPPEVRDLPRLGSAFDGNVEAILAREPDLVLTDEYSGLAEALAPLGVPVYAGTAQSVADFYDTARRVGALLSTDAAAEALVTRVEDDLEAIRARVGERAPVSVYYEIDATPYSAGPDSFVGELLTLAGGDNVVPAHLGEFPELAPERILQADPDVIVLADAPHGESLETLRQRPGWDTLSAVREGRVVELTQAQVDLLSRAGPRLPEALRTLAAILHPGAF